MTLSNEIHQGKPFQSQTEHVVVNLIYTHNWFTLKQRKVLKKFNLSLETYNVLRILRGHSPKPITVKGITERMLDKLSNASRLVDTLVLAGLVDRKNSIEDRRAVEIVIKKQGLDLLTKVDKAMSALLAEHGNLNEEESIELNGLLDKFRGTL